MTYLFVALFPIVMSAGILGIREMRRRGNWRP